MSRRYWAGRSRPVQIATLVVGVALLALVLWSVTRTAPPSPSAMTGTWLGAGTVYDSSGGGSNQVALLMRLTQSSDGVITGSASECNDHGQTASFAVTGLAQGRMLTLAFSGVVLSGTRTSGAYPLTGSVNGTSLVLTLRSGNANDFATACDTLVHVEATPAP